MNISPLGEAQYLAALQAASRYIVLLAGLQRPTSENALWQRNSNTLVILVNIQIGIWKTGKLFAERAERSFHTRDLKDAESLRR